jgi:hypothetical protein
MKKFLFLAALIIVSSCNSDDVETRPFYLGFTPFPYAISQAAADFTYERIAADADIVNHHFDNGVPWVEAENNEPFHANITNDWQFRKNSTPAGHKVYVSVTPINFLRTGIANYRAEEEDMELPAPWDTYSFNSEPVKKAYLTYCTQIIDFFEPDFFNMAIEANLLYFNESPLWDDYLELHEYIYTELKSEYPDLPVFCSVVGPHMLAETFAHNDHLALRTATVRLLEYSDLYALSLYPYLTAYLGNPYPDNMLAELFSISNKPLAIAETGYAAQAFSIDTEGGTLTIVSDQDKQEKYITDLLKACTKRNAKFVINFVLRDYDDLWQEIGSPTDVAIAWRDSGLYDESGNTRKAFEIWKAYLGKPLP